MSGHTPGPWKMKFEEEFAELDQGFLITMGTFLDGTDFPYDIHQIVYASNLYPEEERFGEAQANARLIAAAPDMLKALREFIRVADSEHTVTNRGAAYELAVFAIAKAEGKT